MSGFTDDSPPFCDQSCLLPNAKGALWSRLRQMRLFKSFSSRSILINRENFNYHAEHWNRVASIPGTASIGNNFRTVISYPVRAVQEQCGLDPISCLPKAASLSVKLRAAKISARYEYRAEEGGFPYDGIVDAAGIRSTAEGKRRCALQI